MNIALSEHCSIFSPENEAHLHRLLYTVAKRWHAIVRPSPERLKGMLPVHVWDVYGEFLRHSHKVAVNSGSAWVSHSDCSACDSEKVARFYGLPSLLLVENARTDGGWVKLVATRFRPSIARRFAGKGAMISVAQAGGVGEIPKELRRLAPAYLEARPNEQVPLRILVVADSDAKAPGMPSQQAKNVEDTAKEVGATAHVLRKRAIENYVPDESLLNYGRIRADRMPTVRQVVALSGPARDHYPLKTGLSESDVTAFSNAYPPEMRNGLGLGDFIQDILDNFAHSVTERGLRTRDGSSELDELLDKLERNL